MTVDELIAALQSLSRSGLGHLPAMTVHPRRWQEVTSVVEEELEEVTSVAEGTRKDLDKPELRAVVIL